MSRKTSRGTVPVSPFRRCLPSLVRTVSDPTPQQVESVRVSPEPRTRTTTRWQGKRTPRTRRQGRYSPPPVFPVSCPSVPSGSTRCPSVHRVRDHASRVRRLDHPLLVHASGHDGSCRTRGPIFECVYPRCRGRDGLCEREWTVPRTTCPRRPSE